MIEQLYLCLLCVLVVLEQNGMCFEGIIKVCLSRSFVYCQLVGSKDHICLRLIV